RTPVCSLPLFGCDGSSCHALPPSKISPLSLHDALPIYRAAAEPAARHARTKHSGNSQRRVHQEVQFLAAHFVIVLQASVRFHHQDRKSTRLNSSHGSISYAVFCLKKKKK